MIAWNNKGKLEMNYWGLLGIEPTENEDIIRKAYAELTKKCHPEEHPEEFKSLQSAYKTALKYAKGSKNKQEDVYSDLMFGFEDTDVNQSNEPIPPKWILDSGLPNDTTINDLFKEFINRFSYIANNDIFKNELGSWMCLFELKEYQSLMEQPLFWYNIAILLKDSGVICEVVSYYIVTKAEIKIQNVELIDFLKSVVNFSKDQQKLYQVVIADSDRIKIFFSAAEKYLMDFEYADADKKLYQVKNQIEAVKKNFIKEDKKKKPFKYSWICILIVIALIKAITLNNNVEQVQYQISDTEDTESDIESDEDFYIVEPEKYYISENKPYDIVKMTYEFSEQEENIWYYFDIVYPQIVYKDGTSADKINKLFKSIAMRIPDSTYIKPVDEVKEDIKNGDANEYTSFVDYNITYMDENLISVVFNEYYSYGSSDKEYDNLITCNINLQTGESYDLKDVFAVDETLASSYLEKLKNDDPSVQGVIGLTIEDAVNILQGKVSNKKYKAGFALLKNDIIIFFNHNKNIERYDLGFQYVYFTTEEISPYKANEDFWSLVVSE